MLKLAYRLEELTFGKLMEVYIGDNEENGARLYPHLPKQRQLLEAEQDFLQYLQEGFFDRPGDVYCLWEVDGKYKSALRLQRYQDGLLLEALETAPWERRKGYGLALVEAAVKSFSNEKIYVHIEKWNKASVLLHKKCGFQKISDSAVYADGSVTSRAATYLLERKE